MGQPNPNIVSSVPVAEAEEIKTVIDDIAKLGYGDNSKRVMYLFKLADDEFDPDENRLIIESVKGLFNYLNFGCYFKSEAALGLNPDGSLSAEWHLKCGDYINIDFIDENSISYSFVVGTGKSEISEDGISNLSEINEILAKYKINKE